jgi:hypothetical protein
MLSEVFDASGPAVSQAVDDPGGATPYAGAALGAVQREHFTRVRELLLLLLLLLLLHSQMVQLFGAEAADPACKPELFWQDWANEAETCSAADIAEVGLQGGGYLEGALVATGRLADPPRLQALRDKLARQRLVAPLFDVAAYTLSLEALYGAMWQRHRAGLAPVALAAYAAANVHSLAPDAAREARAQVVAHALHSSASLI